jgi:hypothetical protein
MNELKQSHLDKHIKVVDFEKKFSYRGVDVSMFLHCNPTDSISYGLFNESSRNVVLRAVITFPKLATFFPLEGYFESRFNLYAHELTTEGKILLSDSTSPASGIWQIYVFFPTSHDAKDDVDEYGDKKWYGPETDPLVSESIDHFHHRVKQDIDLILDSDGRMENITTCSHNHEERSHVVVGKKHFDRPLPCHQKD